MTMWTAKCSLKSGTTSGIRLTSSTRRRNLVYVNTGHTKKDGTTDEKKHERKLKLLMFLKIYSLKQAYVVVNFLQTTVYLLNKIFMRSTIDRKEKVEKLYISI